MLPVGGAAPGQASLTCLPEDLLDLLYTNLDSRVRQAFRTSCAPIYRSPAINTHVTSLSVAGSSTSAASKIGAFPKHARLTTLRMRNVNIIQVLTECKSPCNAPAWDRLKGVRDLTIEVCRAVPSDARSLALVPAAFPVLEEEGGSLEVHGWLQDLSVNFFKMLWQSRMKLKGLSLECMGKGLPPALLAQSKGLQDLHLSGSLHRLHLTPLATLPHLRMLSLSGSRKPVNLSPLANLQHLHSLILRSMEPLNLEHVLQHIPLLHQLRLDIDVRLPGAVHYASHSLKRIESEVLTPQVVEWLAVGHVPALQTIQIEGIDLSSWEGLMDQQILDQARAFASKAAAMPLKVCVPEREAFLVSGWYRPPMPDEETPERWPSEFCQSLSLALEPLSRVLPSIQKLELELWDMTSSHSVAVVSNLLGSVQELEVGFLGCYKNDKPVLWAIVQGLPSLKSMDVMTLSWDHKQLFSFLSACAHASRPFCLVVSYDAEARNAYLSQVGAGAEALSAHSFYLQKAESKWSRMKKHVPGAEDVWLKFRFCAVATKL